MGYNTALWGAVYLEPQLNPHEVAYLQALAECVYESFQSGLYTVNFDPAARGGPAAMPTGVNNVPSGVCPWTASYDGQALECVETERPDDPAEWMAYLIDTFLKPGASLATELARPRPGLAYPAALNSFTFNHVANGVIDAQGEAFDDRWRIAVRDNIVYVQEGEVTFRDESRVFTTRVA